MRPVDLTPFGFTGTESTVYAALLRLGTATGYAVARATRVARANVYAALEGLVARNAAALVPGRPARYRPTDPTGLLALLAAEQATALDRLEHELRGVGGEPTSAVHEIIGERPLSTLLLRTVARAERRVIGTVTGVVWRATLPAWRRASTRASLEVRSAGPVSDESGLLAGEAAEDAGTAVVVDDAWACIGVGAGEQTRGLWSSHPVFVTLVRRLLGAAS